MHRKAYLVILAAVAVALNACGGTSPTTPGGGQVPELAGSTYDLVAIDGDSLPYPDGTSSGCTAPDSATYPLMETRIAGMQLGFETSVVYTLRVTTEQRCLADDGVTPVTQWSTNSQSSSGTYEFAGASGTLKLGGAAFPTTISGDEISVFFLPSIAYLFRRE